MPPRNLFPLFCVFFLFSFAVPAHAQNAALSPLTAEISRLENISRGASPGERHDAFISLARLHRLSGNPEAAVKCLDGALSAVPGDGRALFERGRLLISLGEYEKAAESAAALLAANKDREYLLQGRYLLAMIEAFRSGNIRLLAALVEEGDFSEYLGEIYYTLWKLGEDPSWKARLAAEFPQSPEAKIAGGKALSAATPLWILFPGREGFSLSASSAAATPPASTPSGTTPSVSTPSAVAQGAATQAAAAAVLQTGLFSREDNASALADRLKKAGFQPQVQRRFVNGGNYYAVIVPGGSDVNAMIKKLKDAGFESFPVK